MEKFTDKPDYEGFVKHVQWYDDNRISYGISDLKRLSRIYRTPIPDEYKTKVKLNEDRFIR